MSKDKKVFLAEIILCILTISLIYYMQYVTYANVFDTRLLTVILVTFLFSNIINYKSRDSKSEPKLFILTVVLVVFSFVYLIYVSPAITYKEGYEIIKSSDYSEVSSLDPNSILYFDMPSSNHIKKAYLYQGKKSSTSYYILVSPIDGAIYTEEINSGNYLDLFFELTRN
jgi:hypothetical protein